MTNIHKKLNTEIKSLKQKKQRTQPTKIKKE